MDNYLLVLILLGFISIVIQIMFLWAMSEIHTEVRAIKIQIRNILTKKLLADLYTIEELEKQLEKLKTENNN